MQRGPIDAASSPAVTAAAPVGANGSAASRLYDDEAGSGSIDELRDVFPIAGDDLGLPADRQSDDRRVYYLTGPRPAEEPAHGVSHRLIEGKDLAAPQQASQLRLSG